MEAAGVLISELGLAEVRSVVFSLSGMGAKSCQTVLAMSKSAGFVGSPVTTKLPACPPERGSLCTRHDMPYAHDRH